MTIGAAARMLDIPAWRLRAWERAGLLSAQRSENGYRLYWPHDLDRARRIASELEGAGRLAAFGLSFVDSEVPAASPSDDISAVDRADTGPAHELDVIRRLVHSISHNENRDDLPALAVKSALEITGSSAGALSSADFTRQQYVLLSCIGLSERYARGIGSWKLHEGLAGRAFGLREPLVVHDLQVDRHVARDVVRLEGLRGYVCIPLLHGQRRLGVLEVFSRKAGRFRRADVTKLELIASAFAPVLALEESERHLTSLQEERTRMVREWSNQLVSAHDRDRAATTERLRGIVSESIAGAPPKATRRQIEDLIDELTTDRVAPIDLIPLMKENVVRRISALHNIEVLLDASDFPAALPSVLSSHLYLLILALVEDAATVARSRVVVSLSQTRTDLVISAADDRESDSGAIAPTLSASVTSAIRNVGGQTLRPYARRGGMVEVAVIVPRGEADPRGADLTRREREVLAALRYGSANRDIASGLGISAKTLQNHLSSIYRKLEVASRAEAIRLADTVLLTPSVDR